MLMLPGALKQSLPGTEVPLLLISHNQAGGCLLLCWDKCLPHPDEGYKNICHW